MKQESILKYLNSFLNVIFRVKLPGSVIACLRASMKFIRFILKRLPWMFNGSKLSSGSSLSQSSFSIFKNIYFCSDYGIRVHHDQMHFQCLKTILGSTFKINTGHYSSKYSSSCVAKPGINLKIIISPVYNAMFKQTWLIDTPVSSAMCSFSACEGYGWLTCSNNHFRNVVSASLKNFILWWHWRRSGWITLVLVEKL